MREHQNLLPKILLLKYLAHGNGIWFLLSAFYDFLFIFIISFSSMIYWFSIFFKSVWGFKCHWQQNFIFLCIILFFGWKIVLFWKNMKRLLRYLLTYFKSLFFRNIFLSFSRAYLMRMNNCIEKQKLKLFLCFVLLRPCLAYFFVCELKWKKKFQSNWIFNTPSYRSFCSLVLRVIRATIELMLSIKLNLLSLMLFRTAIFGCFTPLEANKQAMIIKKNQKEKVFHIHKKIW